MDKPQVIVSYGFCAWAVGGSSRMRGLRGAVHHALEIRLGSPKAAEFFIPLRGIK